MSRAGAIAIDQVLDRRRERRRRTASDRRYHERVKVDLLINRFLNGQPYMCRMIDISRTGARLVPMHRAGRQPRARATWGCSSSSRTATRS